MPSRFNSKAEFTNGGSDDKRLLHLTRLKPPAEYSIPLEAFYLTPQKLQLAKTLARQGGNLGQPADCRKNRSTDIVFDVA
jgi:hypothetical protein